MEAQTTAVTIQDTTSNPAPLGLLGFGMTTVLLNLHNAGLFELSSMILAMGIFYGGIAQIIAGLIEVKKKNTFGATAFISYGFFWLSFVGLLVLPKTGWTDAVFRRCDKRLPAAVGSFYGLHVCRHTQIEPVFAIRLWFLDYPVCVIGGWHPRWQRSDRTDCRHRGRHLWPLRHLHGYGSRPQRNIQEECTAHVTIFETFAGLRHVYGCAVWFQRAGAYRTKSIQHRVIKNPR